MPKGLEEEADMTQHTVLVVGATGRTGRLVLQQLLSRGVHVRAIVRSSAKLPADVVGNPNLVVIEAPVLSLREDELQEHLRGCDAILSCLGHVISLAGIFGSPRDLVTRTVTRLCRAVEALGPPAPVKVILMSSVSVNRPGHQDVRRSAFERAFLWVLRALLPPSKDNQRAADFLIEQIGQNNACVEWTAVRPDTLLEGDVSEYTVHEGLVNGLFSPGSTNMGNVAHFMCELATRPDAWAKWNGKLPVIVNAGAKPAESA